MSSCLGASSVATPIPLWLRGPLAKHGTQAEVLRAQARREPEERQPCRWVKVQGRGGKEARRKLTYECVCPASPLKSRHPPMFLPLRQIGSPLQVLSQPRDLAIILVNDGLLVGVFLTDDALVSVKAVATLARAVSL